MFCDLGTDCADCGAWVHPLPAAAEVAAPVAFLRGRGIEVYTKWTDTLPAFLMAYTNPEQDVDVSGQMHFNANIELGLTQVRQHSLCLYQCPPSAAMHAGCACSTATLCFHDGAHKCKSTCSQRCRRLNAALDTPVQVWYTLLSGKCVEVEREQPMPGIPEKGRQQQPEQHLHRRLVADVGANFGYYSLYAAAHGCRRAFTQCPLHAACLACPYGQPNPFGSTHG